MARRKPNSVNLRLGVSLPNLCDATPQAFRRVTEYVAINQALGERMDSFELNKIAGAILFTLLVYLGVQNLGDVLFSPKPADPNAYIVEGVVEEGAPVVASVAEPVVPISELLQTASIEKGVKVAKKCVSCHSFDIGGANKIGPALWGIVDRDIAASTGFNYSSALSGKDGIWDYEALNGFLENPKKYATGTNMAFAGLRKAKDRANIIAYLDSLKD
ncbi:MAG: cytochrome c family protein [Hyphomicrobiales bacterium]|jgi:cytochrome c|nr:MAG: cytochrome c family protein [Hyphomicrobiales bacterium]